MLQFFRTNQQLFGIFLLFYAALLRLGWWLSPRPELPDAVGIGSDWLEVPILQHPSAAWGIGILLLCIQAWLMISIIFHHRLSKNTDLLPGLGIVLLGSMLPAFLPISSFGLANIAVLLALRAQLLTYRQTSAADLLFNTGFYVGVAALFQPTYLLLLPFVAISTTLLRSGRVRDQSTLLLGAFVPLFLVGFGYYWYDHFDYFWQQQWGKAFQLPQQWTFTQIPWLELSVMGILLLFVLFQRRQYLKKTKMDVQVKLGIFYWYLLGLGLSVLFAQPWHLYRWQAIVPIAGAFLGLSFSQANKRRAEAWHLIMLVLVGFLWWWAAN